MKFKKGDLVSVNGTHKVFRIVEFTKDSGLVPNGWIIDQQGLYVNPSNCKKYEGATSCLAT